MLSVFKYPVSTAGYFDLGLPDGAEILTVQVQHNEPKIWALVKPDNPTERRRFLSAATGAGLSESKENLVYIGTFQLDDGAYVGHLFEIK